MSKQDKAPALKDEQASDKDVLTPDEIEEILEKLELEVKRKG